MVMLTSLEVCVFAILATRELRIVNMRSATYLHHLLRSKVKVGMSGRFA